MTERTPTREFGKRRPAPIEPPEPLKRSNHVALLVMGTLAVGASAYTLMPGRNCGPDSPGMAAPALPQNDGACTFRASSGGGGGGGGRRGTSKGSPSEAESGHVMRGGFGSFARAFGFGGS